MCLLEHIAETMNEFRKRQSSHFRKSVRMSRRQDKKMGRDGKKVGELLQELSIYAEGRPSSVDLVRKAYQGHAMSCHIAGVCRLPKGEGRASVTTELCDPGHGEENTIFQTYGERSSHTQRVQLRTQPRPHVE